MLSGEGRPVLSPSRCGTPVPTSSFQKLSLEDLHKLNGLTFFAYSPAKAKRLECGTQAPIFQKGQLAPLPQLRRRLLRHDLLLAAVAAALVTVPVARVDRAVSRLVRPLAVPLARAPLALVHGAVSVPAKRKGAGWSGGGAPSRLRSALRWAVL